MTVRAGTVRSKDAAPLVSVVMPFKDAVEHLAEAVGSVLGQTYEHYELLLVDDGGTDGSREIAATLAAAAPSRVRVLAHPGRVNRGTGPSRALGITSARGALTAFLDADDRWDAGHLEHEVRLLQTSPDAALVCGRTWYWRSWADPPAVDTLSPLAFAPGVVVPPPRLLAAVLRQGALTTATCSLLAPTEALRAAVDPLAGFPRMYEDQVLNSVLLLHLPAVMSGATSAWYRQHERSATAAAIRDGSFTRAAVDESRLRFLRWLDERPELDRATADPELRDLLDAALQEQEPPRPRTTGRTVTALARRLAAPPVTSAAKGLLRRPGLVRLRIGSLSVVEPVSRQSGSERGLPVDRYYVEDFLAKWAEDVRGRVLEDGEPAYSQRFGGSRVTRADVLDVHEGAEGTDLAHGTGLPDAAFDCLLLTQTLHLVFDVHAAARTMHRILRPGGSVLVTVPGISPVSAEPWAETWHWSFTRHSARRLFEGVFGAHNVQVEQYGNAVSALGRLQGLAAHELAPRVLDTRDEQFPVTVAVRAVRPASEL